MFYKRGGPTLEMWVNSWNEREKGAKNFSKLYAVPKTGENDYGYYIGTVENEESISANLLYIGENGNEGKKGTGYYDTLYFPHRMSDAGDLDNDKAKEYVNGYWVASPSAHGEFQMMYVQNDASVGEIWFFNTDVRFTSSSLSRI